MKYVGMQTQIWRNNRNTFFLLCLYPLIILAAVWVFIFVCDYLVITCAFLEDLWAETQPGLYQSCQENENPGIVHWDVIWYCFLKALPYTLGITALWFLVAYFFNVQIIQRVTHARPLERKENLRVYNIVENLCIAGGIDMPRINIIDDPGLNAFASGINTKTFTISLTKGIIDKLNNEELSAVVAHELTHIRNRDTRLMVICIVFVGLLSMLQSIFIGVIKGVVYSPRHHDDDDDSDGGAGIFVILLVAFIGLFVSSAAYFFSYVNRLAISRKREYVADAGAAELCGNPLALVSALRKVSKKPGLADVKRSDVAQLYIIHPDEKGGKGLIRGLKKKVDTIFSTHPDTSERIKILEQF